MFKILALMTLFLLVACTDNKKVEQVIIPEAQLQALEKAKDLEKELLQIQQKKQQQYKEQGL